MRAGQIYLIIAIVLFGISFLEEKQKVHGTNFKNGVRYGLIREFVFTVYPIMKTHIIQFD